jgi:RNA polymerase sigma-70 factor (ECF subfamily)
MNVSENTGPDFLPDWEQAEPEDLEEILKRHLPWIQAYVHRKLGSMWRSKAETGDIVQEAMIQFLRHGPRVKLTNDRQFRALLCRIIENVVCDQYDWFTARRRAMAREQPLPGDTVLNLDPPMGKVDTPSQIVQQQEKEAWIRLGLELMKPKEREVIILRKWEDLSFAEIGERLGVGKSVARRKYLRSIEILIETVKALQSGRLEAVIGEEEE